MMWFTLQTWSYARAGRAGIASRCPFPQNAEYEPSGSFQTVRWQPGKTQRVSWLRVLSGHITGDRVWKKTAAKVEASFIPIHDRLTAWEQEEYPRIIRVLCFRKEFYLRRCRAPWTGSCMPTTRKEVAMSAIRISRSFLRFQSNTTGLVRHVLNVCKPGIFGWQWHLEEAYRVLWYRIMELRPKI